MSKNKCIFDSPILIGSIVLSNSKCNLYNYALILSQSYLVEKIFFLV